MLVIAIVWSVRVGTWAASNSDVFAQFDKCIAQAANRADVSTCISASRARPRVFDADGGYHCVHGPSVAVPGWRLNGTHGLVTAIRPASIHAGQHHGPGSMSDRGQTWPLQR